MTIQLHHGDCLEFMRTLPAGSVDAVVTDPPYGLRFMGKHWDYDVPSVDIWRECLRVLKPGGHLLSFAGTRTQHRMAVRIEDAGFEIRDMIAWVYGSGFPKSHNLSDEWQGWGTALKPALEPITVARKPLTGTVAQNVTQWGTGAINVDACRVGYVNDADKENAQPQGAWTGKPTGHINEPLSGRSIEREALGKWEQPAGRWPANLIHDGSDEVVGLFPQTTTGNIKPHKAKSQAEYRQLHVDEITSYHTGDTGSAARFFYCAKASKRDRDEGLEGMEAIHRPNGNKWTDQDYRVTRGERPPSAESGPRRNHHPTVKPTDLMRYLCRLVTPPAGIVFDPFAGSGSTGKGAVLEGFSFIGCEISQEYFEIAQRRIEAAQPALIGGAS